MARETDTYQGFMHAGAGTGQILILLSALIPGLVPALALLGVIAAVVIVPIVVLGLAATLAIAPPFGLWRLATRGRRRRRREQRAPRVASSNSAPSRAAPTQQLQIRSAT